MSNGILAGLTNGANYFVQAVKSVLSGGGYPSGDAERGYIPIQDGIIIEPAQENGDKAFINVVIDTSKDSSTPYAAAYEFGSGEHATVGTKGKYKIRPKEGSKGYLAFPWQPANPEGARNSWKYIDDSGDVWFFTEVDHPGVEGKPYLRPTLEKEAQKIAEIIGKDFEDELIMQIFGASGMREERIVVNV